MTISTDWQEDERSERLRAAMARRREAGGDEATEWEAALPEDPGLPAEADEVVAQVLSRGQADDEG